MNPPVFDQINLIARDLDLTLAFYRRLGLDIPDAWSTASGAHHAEVRMPSGVCLEFDSVEFSRHWNAGARVPTGDGCRVVLGFTVASREAVDALHSELVQSGAPSRQEPYDAFWGARYAIVADPDGNDVGLMSPIDPDRQTAPPEL